MSGRYSVEDLLRLRASPLIDKPSNLTEIHAVINAQVAPEPAGKRGATARPRIDDALSPSESFQKRPLLDGAQRKSTTDPERIVLGPPRRSFASSTARTNGKAGEGEEGFKEKEHEKVRGGDRYGEKRTNGRFTRDTEPDDKYGRRRHEEGEERPRRPKWAQEEGEDTRREARSGKKFDQPWFKGERGGELEETGRDSEPGWRRVGGGKDRGWGGREAPADVDPEWMDGEDDAAAPGRTQADLQRWLQERKAKELGIEPPAEQAAPATALLADQSAKSNLPQFFDAEADDSMDKFFTRLSEQKAPTTQPAVAAAKPHGKSRFGALFGPSPIDTQKVASPDAPPLPMSAPAPAPKEPKNTDPVQQMFGMSLREKMPTSPAAVAAAGPKTAGAVDPDQAAFARILDMLQGRSSNSTTPSQQPQTQQPAASGQQPREQKARVPLYARDSQQKVDSPKDTSSPLLALLGGQAPPPQSTAPPPSQHEPPIRRSTGHDRLDMSRSPVDSSHGRQSSQKDELLLNLLKQASQAPKPTPPSEQYAHRPMSTEHSNRMAMARNELPPPPDASHLRGYTHGPPEERMRFNDDPMMYNHGPRRQNSEANRPMYEDSLLESLRNAPPPHGHGLPPGLSRPPGFDQQMPSRMPPPGWNGPPPPPQQQPSQGRQPGPSSNIPNNSRPNIPPGYGMPPPPQGRDGRPPPQSAGPQQPGPQRKYTNDSGMPMGPPPGFAGNAQPPGFPSLMPHPSQMQQQQGGGGHQQGSGGGRDAPPPSGMFANLVPHPSQLSHGQQQQQQQQGPPRGYSVQSPPDQGPGRQFMDMYSDGPGRNGVRGMGGYR